MISRILPGLVFLSGMASLIYQVLWLRGFALVLGSTIYSLSCVITVFMLGLAVGSATITRCPTVLRVRPLRAYALIELLIGVFGGFVTYIVFHYQEALLRMVPLTSSSIELMAYHFVLAFVLLIVPTWCMGATLPILGLATRDANIITKLYGLNTLGAACGSLLASFVLIHSFGVPGALVAAVAMNIVIALVASCITEETHDQEQIVPQCEARHQDVRSIWILAAISGFVFLSLEIVWSRMLSLILGNRVYVLSIVLFIILCSLGVAARLSALLSRRFAAAQVQLTVVAASILLLALSLQFNGPLVFSHSIPAEQISDATALRLLYIIVGIVTPALLLGLIFPLLLSDLRSKGDLFAADIGRLYAINTIACIFGSLLTGYVLIEHVGSHKTIFINILILCGLLAWLIRCSGGTPSRLMRFVAGCSAVGIFLSLVSIQRPIFVSSEQSTILTREDAHGIFTLFKVSDTELGVLNNSTPLVYHYGNPRTQFVQETQAYLPALYAERLDRVLNIGIGYGITTGAFTRIPAIKRIDAIEIVPAMVEEAARFSVKNYQYMNDPRVHVVVTDGRHFLARAQQPYDVISINVSDPYLPGSSSLFSSDFYALVKQKLSKSGIVCQHIFGPDAETLYHIFREAFPYTAAIPAYGNGVTVIGSLEPLLQQRRDSFLAQEQTDEPLFKNISPHSLKDLFTLIGEGEQILQRYEQRQPEFSNSDLYPNLEYRRAPEKVSTFFSSF